MLKQWFASAQQVIDEASAVTQLEVSVAGDKAAISRRKHSSVTRRLPRPSMESPVSGTWDIVGRSIASGFVVDDAIVMADAAARI
jgi:hypothetical protein